MRVAHSLIAVGLAATASASPIMDALLGRSAQATGNPCDGGRTYCGWWDKAKKIEPQCKCNKGWSWDESRRECRAPVIPRPQLKPTQRAICARSETDWCDYNERDDRCRADGKSSVIIVETVRPDTVLPPILPPPIVKEIEKPRCAAQMYYDDSIRQCRYPSFPSSSVTTCKERGGRAICARTPEQWCEYDTRQSWCQDDGINALQCLEPHADEEVTLDKIYAALPYAIEVMGYECMNRGRDCPLNKGSDYDQFCIGNDCVAGMICSMVYIPGFC